MCLCVIHVLGIVFSFGNAKSFAFKTVNSTVRIREIMLGVISRTIVNLP